MKNMLIPIVAAIAMTIVCTTYAQPYNGKWSSWFINGIDENSCVLGGEGDLECYGECVKEYETWRECFSTEEDPECNEYDYEWEYVSSSTACNPVWCNCEASI